MDQFMDTYFGPLSKEYCLYFYALSVFFGSMFVFVIIGIVTFMIMNFKKVNTLFIANSFLVLFNFLIAYLVNRLLNTMCTKTL